MQNSLFDHPTAIKQGDFPFATVLNILNVKLTSGWPDQFGKAIRSEIICRYSPVRTLSLFSGGGGLDIGFHDAGFDIVEMVEIEQKYVQTLNANARQGGYFDGANVKCMDIREYHPSNDLNVDFIIGGPPCQTFSAAGRRAAGVRGTSDPRGMLFREYVRILETLQPTGFLFENVYGITGAQDGGAWAEIRSAFRAAGYTIFYRILDAADYGVPQHRERLFIVGLRQGRFAFPLPTHGPDSPSNYAYYTAAEAISDLENDEGLEGIGGRFGYLLNDIPPGLNYSFYTKEMGHPNPIFSWRSKFSDYLYKADPNMPVRTLKAQVGAYSGPFHWGNRAFTIAEHKRLQTFPDQYQLIGSRQVCIQQIGNSVPPQLGRMLALSIQNQVFRHSLPFSVHSMPEDMKLGFRQRKRQLTARYASKAAIGMQTLSEKANGNEPKLISDASYSKSLRYLGNGFSWEQAKTADALSIHITNSLQNDIWQITGATSGLSESDYCYRVIVSPSVGYGWPLSQREVQLDGLDWNPLLFTSLWKAFEETLSQTYGVADLVQLFGYYQYLSKVRIVMSLNRSTPPSALWAALLQIVRNVGVATQCTAHELALLWSLEETDIVPLLVDLRSIGYEIRSHNTNPQIREGVFLVPYAFPTLTPRSVQLRKSI